MTDDYVEMMSKVCKMCFGGSLPAVNDEILIDAVMAALRCTTLSDQPALVLDTFRNGLREGLATLRLAASVAASSGWTN